MKITDLRCAVIGKHPIVRVVTDEGLYGLGEVAEAQRRLEEGGVRGKLVLDVTGSGSLPAES